MISEEKVADIIQNKGSVWCINKWSKPYHIQQVVFDGKQKINPHTFVTGWGAENIYETEEEAREFLKYSDITRTEKFPYVSWEEIDKDFQNLANGTYTIAEDKYKFSLNIKVNKPFVSQILLVTEEANFNWNYSRENYHKALDLCVKLFKGEE